MSSSRSDVVTQSVHPFVRSLVRHEGVYQSLNRMSLVFYLVLKSFNGVSRKFKGRLKFQGCFKEVSRMFLGRFKGAYRKFQGCFMKVSRVFHGSLRVF